MVLVTGILVLEGIFLSIFIGMTVFVGLSICRKYFNKNEYEYILIGVAWIGLASGWIPDVICFVLNVIVPSTSPWYVAPEWYLIVGNGIMPLFVLFWMLALKKLIYEKQGVVILVGVNIISLIYTILFWSYLFLDVSVLATFETGLYTVSFGIFIQGYIFFVLILFAITGIHFSYMAIETSRPDLKLRGILLIISILLFIIGSLLGSVIPPSVPDLINIMVFKSILIISSFLYYVAFVLPSWARKLFIK